jgi:hypothetical protein
MQMLSETPAPVRRRAERSPDPSLLAARLIVMAARSLANDHTVTVDASLCRAAAASLAGALARPLVHRADILAASPFVVERSGRSKTLVEMIENEDGDDAAKIRLARLLLRAIDWF